MEAYMAKRDVVDFNVLESISVITKKLAGSKLKIRQTQEFLKAEENLNKYFRTTTYGTWILCGIISYYFDNNGEECNFNNLASFFSVPVMSIIAYKTDVEALLSKGYIKNSQTLKKNEIGLKNEFKVSQELLSFILHNKKIEELHNNDSDDSILEGLKIFGQAIENSEDWIGKILQLKEFEDYYEEEEFIKTVKRLVSTDYEARMFFYDCCSDLLRSVETNLNRTIEDIYTGANKITIAESFMNEKHILIKSDLLEFVEKGNLTEATLDLTVKAKEMLLGDKVDLFMKETNGMDLILPDSITPKELFYADNILNEIDRLKSSLYEDKLKSIQHRLSEEGLQKGIAVLLYGSLGTGKTESVYQIAKETGRMILHVDISTSKSCWFGESEKNIKKIFTDYRRLCKCSKNNPDGRCPILLFNEADGILSKRKSSTFSSVSQTENTIQNIILEEMEKLEGIMICTTNLAENLDSAFERRFLFKIKFENPTDKIKQKIWKSKIDWLSDEILSELAGKYDFSGGQIDNIVRKITMDEILTGNHPEIIKLYEICENEKLGNSNRTIGFK